jgi:eukaryotic-like serine/threonine-protein kinase
VHLDDNALEAFVNGSLSDVEKSSVRGHLDNCPDCLAVMVHLVKQQPPHLAATALAVGSEPSVAVARRLFEAGEQVGPYVVERVLGVGGMGIVYAAHDPRLDRLVALKVIRHDPGVERVELAERLRRESQALARLSHPNVTVVYELGTADDEIYIAMEYVAGTTLRGWLTETRREPRAILATFVRAGRGLAAAHAAGLVHRDFKPDNVLLARDGSVKVTDFGLARIAGDVLGEAPAGARIAVGSELTISGAVIGTPAYMAPEQFDGKAIDARSDQFAFCVALYEALHGERPFRGTTVAELRAAVVAGRIDAPRTKRGGSRVHRALVRGLAAAPAERFPAMQELLAELAPRRGRVTLAVAGLTTVATVALATSMLAGSEPPPPSCHGGDAEAAAVWSTSRRAVVQQALLATRAPGAAETWSAVERGLDGYLAGWATQRGEACEATHVHHQQSEAVLDLRTACLDRRRSEVDALVGVFERADRDVVLHAREAIAALPDRGTCADVEALLRRTPLPRDPIARERHAGLRRRSDEARAAVEVAHYKEASVALRALVDDPALAEYPDLEAEIQHLRAKVFSAQGSVDEAEQALFRSLVRAQAARADDQVATTAVDLANVVGYRARRIADGTRWVDFASAAIAAKGGDELLTARLETVRAGILQRAGKLAEAEAASRKALAIASRKAPGSTLEAEVNDSLGMMLSLQGKFEESVPMLQKSVALSERLYGTAHSVTASTRTNLANALGSVHRYDEALAAYREALATSEALFGSEGEQVSRVLSNMGQMLQEQHKPADARPLLERALAIRVKVHGPNDPQVARTAANLGYLALDEKAYPQALAHFARTGAILEGTIGADHPARADDLAGTGLALIGLKRPADAIAPLTRASALAAAGDPVNHASIQAALAQALHASGRDRARAATLGRTARKILAEAGETAAVAELDTWLE